MAKRAAIYLRVSRKKQDERSQLPDCRQYCHDHNFQIVEEISDKITGTTAVADRQGGKRVYDLLKRKSIDVVVMWAVDRVARDEDVTEYVVFKRDVRSFGAELHFTDIGKTSDDPTGSITEFAQAAGASAERLKIIRRTKAGKRKKFVEEKRLVLNGVIPFGYRKIGMGKQAYLQVDPVESRLVKDVFKWYVTDRVPMADILERTVESGIPTRHNRQWTKSAVIGILHFAGYKGLFHYGKDTLQLPELEIIPADLWQRAQNALTSNRWIKTSTDNYLLSGSRVKCFCGGSMSGSSTRSKSVNYLYYRCAKGRDLSRDHDKCLERIRADKLDRLVFGWLVLMATDPDHFSRLVADARRNLETEIQPIKDRLESLNGAIADTDAEVARLVKRIAKIADDRIAQPFEDEIIRLTNSKESIKNQIDKAQAELNKFGISGGRVDKRQIEAELNKLLSAETFDQKRQSIEFFDARARLIKDENGEVKIKLSCYLTDDQELYTLDGAGSYPRYIVRAQFGDESAFSSNYPLSTKRIFVSEIVPLAQEFFSKTISQF